MEIKKASKRILTCTLAALMLAGAAVSMPAVIPQSTLTVSAAQTYGDFEYEVKNNKVTITGYTGKGGAAPSSVALNKTAMSLGKGETTKLTAAVAPSNAADKTVAWRTSNSKVLTVDKNGNVKAAGTGTAWITAKTINGKEKSCRITVKNAPSKVTISKGTVTIGVGEKFTVDSAVPNGSAAAKRTFRTSNSSVVKMTKTNWTGSFKAVKPGTAYVTVRTYNGKEASCKITVTK